MTPLPCRRILFLFYVFLNSPFTTYGFPIFKVSRIHETFRATTTIYNHRESSLASPHLVDKSDNRPFAQRTTGPRVARRLNHAFRCLHRHESNDDTTFALHNATNAFDFFHKVIGYTTEEIFQMNHSFPPLLDLHVQRHLKPKLRFLMGTMQLETMEEVRCHVPPQYFGARLERTIAPRHAFLLFKGLTSRRDLILDRYRWQQFLFACRKPKQFCALCNQWQRELNKDHELYSKEIDMQEIHAFDVLFQRGLMAAARNDTSWNNGKCLIDHVKLSSAEWITLLVQHGANPLERDARGSSLLHWAAGMGQLENMKVLLPHFENGILEASERDGSLPLHWAAAGANAREFGIGGHVHVCRFILESGEDAKDIVNQLTKDGNSPLMWGAWAGSLDVVKLLIRNRADPFVTNRNGCTVAHWATSGGSVDCCRYLYKTVGVDFTQPNYGGNTPLTHAVAFGRAEVVKWLRTEVLAGVRNDAVAASLAHDFVVWNSGDSKRKLILSLLQDWEDGIDSDTISSSFDEDQDL